jgi:hypothetical protein
MPKTRAAALKLKYWATTRAFVMATGLIIADFAVVRDNDLRCDMSCSSTRTTDGGMMGSAARCLELWVVFKMTEVQPLGF